MTPDRRPGTRLPEDAAYWEDLSARSVQAAFASSAGGAGSAVAHPPGGVAFELWWRGMSDAAFVLAASAVLALLAGSLLLDQRSPRAMTQRAATESRALTAALAPDDPLLASLLEAPAGPPPASALLRLIAQRKDAR